MCFLICVTVLSAVILLSPYLAEVTDAAVLPSRDNVLESYRQNPYIRFYEGSQGIAWTTIHPGGYSVNANGAYIYGGGVSIYRGAYLTEIVPDGVVSRKEIQGTLPAGCHYYSASLSNDVIPVGRWVLSHVDANCIHGPFEACRDYEYFGINGLSNSKCLALYDSGWIAYCADCGEQITGLVYASEDCVRRIGYIFAGDETFREKYPAEYLFICPICGDNLENDLHLASHDCKCFISANRYEILYDGNGAAGGYMDPSVCYYGGADEYEGASVSGDKYLKTNEYTRPGYVFEGWSDSPAGQVILTDKASTLSVENNFAELSGTGDENNDRQIRLYAVWRKVDTAICISGGSFGESVGSYNGIANGSFTSDRNLFSKGYMYETEVKPGLLGAPRGYRVRLVVPGSGQMPDIYASLELAGWKFETEETGARAVNETVGNISYSGNISGSVSNLSSDGSFTYIHSSEVNNSADYATALWKSTSVILPEAVFPGMVFDGWYTDPDTTPDTYVGKEGDIYIPVSDTVLYAGFSGLELSASPDYMGNDDFGNLRYNGLTDLSIERETGYDLYRYFLSTDYPVCNWTPVLTDDRGSYGEGGIRTYTGGGKYYEYIAPVSGIYVLDLWGGAGASYGEYAGENGEYSTCRIYLNKGDTVGIFTGRAGGVTTTSSGTSCGGGEGSYISVNGQVIMSSAGGKGASFILNVRKEFNYTGTVQSYTADAEGDYTLQVWGAEGSATSAGMAQTGKGGYATGRVHLKAGAVIYICVGGSGGYNGGGAAGRNAYGGCAGTGGGATHIASRTGVLNSLESYKNSVYIVAGGGGGAAGANATSGAGGGSSGGEGISPWPEGERTATGGTQTSGGTCVWGRECNGGFGYGGAGLSYDPDKSTWAMADNGGGGGGWYGGAGGDANWKSYGCGGGGGSGYIGGVTGGRMSSGVRSGNGYALITCSVNISGRAATGRGTEFTPGDLLYAGHLVSSHSSCTYPSADTKKEGYCLITEPAEALYTASDCKIYSPDLASPNPVEDARMIYDPVSGRVEVSWDMPDDNGTDYRYMARAYHSADVLSGAYDKYASTGIEKLNIKTGVYSYYYMIDSSPVRDSAYLRNNGAFIRSAWADISGTSKDAAFDDWYLNADSGSKVSGITFIPDGSDRYLHVIACDRAGNVSSVFNMAVDGEGAHIPYPIYTEDINIRSSSNVYPAEGRERTYYVRADAESIFELEYSAYIRGFARKNYQIDTARFHMSGSEYVRFSFEKNPNVEETFIPTLTGISYSGPFSMQAAGISDASRTDRSARISFTGAFTTMSEEEMFIYPSASATLEESRYVQGFEEGIVLSDAEDDRTHGITLIGDGTPPECLVSVNGSGYDKLNLCNISNVSTDYVVDRRYEDVVIDLFVTDKGSGLKGGFVIDIVNLDNGLEARYTSTDDHYFLNLKQDPDSEDPCFDNMLFNGRFIIRVSSEDNVGNCGNEESVGLTELDVSGEIVRSLDSITGPLIDAQGRRYIKRGESGSVISRVWGYPDAVLVSFDDESMGDRDVLYVIGEKIPDALSGFEGNVIYTDSCGYLYEENTDFTIPLDYGSDVLRVTITGFKGDEVITWETECEIISEGSVLDELMTVLR